MNSGDIIGKRLEPGERVRVDNRAVVGHCRAPWYLRGQTGVIVAVLGVFRDPERLAYLRPGLPRQVLYKVRFKQSELWPGYEGGRHDQLEADLTGNWLTAAPHAAAEKSAGRRAKSA